MKMSEVSSQRSGVGSVRHTATMPRGPESALTGMSTAATTNNVTAASTSVTSRPSWTPSRTP
jgi:hypothetical protein